MKKIKSMALAVIFSVAALSFYQCTNDESLFRGFELEPDYNTLQEVHDLMTQNDTIYFTVSDTEIDNDFNTPQGIRLHFPAASITTGPGAELTLPCQIKFIEIFKRGDIVRHNMQTFTNQTPLVSGGIFWIKGFDSNGNELLFNGATAYIPLLTDVDGYKENMNHFSGATQTTPSGLVNSWMASTGSITFDPAAGTNGEFIMDQFVSGWNSSQSPYDFELLTEEPTQFSVQVTNATGFDKTEVFFANNDFTEVAALTSVEGGGESISTFSGSIAKGATGKLVAVALIEGKLHFGSQDITVNGDDLFSMSVSMGEPVELAALLSSIN